MKTAIYIEDGLLQVVITPETDGEKRILGVLDGPDIEACVQKSSFYQCVGGWIRYSQGGTTEDKSLIVRVKNTQEGSCNNPASAGEGEG